MLKILLESNGYTTASAYSGTEGILVHGDDTDLILLDLMLPGRSGEEIIRELKEKHDVPVIIMSAIHDIDRKVNLFSLGADDYVTKPFHNDELIARISARLRVKTGQEIVKINLKYRDIEIDNNNFTVSCAGKQLDLSKHEFELLKLLVENPDRTCTKSMIYDRVWNYENSADDNIGKYNIFENIIHKYEIQNAIISVTSEPLSGYTLSCAVVSILGSVIITAFGYTIFRKQEI